MLYLQSPRINPYFNLALEQYIFEHLDKQQEYFILWQNRCTVVLGKHQNAFAEIDYAYAKENAIDIVRRLSGGGAVYQDLGNLNFTFIRKDKGEGSSAFQEFCRPIIKALTALGLPVEINGRNDLTLFGKKFSGNAQYQREGRRLHHGTILLETELPKMERVLTVAEDKLQAKGIASVRSRVTNLLPHLAKPITIQEFCTYLRGSILKETDSELQLTQEDLHAIEKLQKQRYEAWEWNFGSSQEYAIQKTRRIEGCGTITIGMTAMLGRIERFSVSGDYFSERDTEELYAILQGCPLEKGALERALDGVKIETFFHGISREAFLESILQ